MDGIIIEGKLGKLWKCKKDGGHALGLLVRVKENGLCLDRLLLFRNAVLPEFAASEAKIIGSVEGTMCDIKCDLCDSKRTWWMGEAALERFLSSRRERRSPVVV